MSTLYTWTVVCLCLIAGGLLCVVLGGAAALAGDRQRRVAHTILRCAYGAVVRLLPFRCRVTGGENLVGGPFVICPNHQSYSDVVYLYELGLPFRWIVKRELFNLPLFGSAMRMARYHAIDRATAASAYALLQRVCETLQAGISVVSFPEGTRSREGALGRFHAGPARMAIAAGVPLVPVGVIGTHAILPPGSATYPGRGCVRIHIGTPLSTAGLRASDAGRLTAQLRRAVQEAKGVAAGG